MIVLWISAALATAAPAADHAELRDIAAEVSTEALHDSLAHLVGFGTRHTLSDTTSNSRGIGAARRWAAGRFQLLSAACGGCIRIETPQQSFTNARVPQPSLVQDVIAIQKGDGDPDRVVIIAGHIDSRVTDIMNATSDAPGANDDGSGVAAVLEAARVLSKHHFRATLVYAVLSGEEQGLLGGKVLADFARAQGWRVEADLNNDIIGNSEGQGGERVRDLVRVFSEGVRATETAAEAEKRRLNGGELDSPSRNLSRYMADLADQYLAPFSVKMIYRADRFGRGGDQLPMQAAGFPAVRVTEGAENYRCQHQDLRVENGVVFGDRLEGVDLAYLANVTRLDLITLAALAKAPAPPTGVQVSGAVSADTHLSWTPVPEASGYVVRKRDTTLPRWGEAYTAVARDHLDLPHTVIDDWAFGVQSVSPDGYESPVVFPGPAGDFNPPKPGG